MIKKVLVCLCIAAFLTGCGSNASQQEKEESKMIVGTFENVEVVGKRYEPCGAKCGDKWYVTIEKNDEQIVLQMFGEDAYNVLKKGNHVNLKYTKNYFIKEIQFVNFEEPKQ